MPAAGLPQAHEELPHPLGSVHFPRLPVQDAHAVDQCTIPLGARTLWPSLPGIEAAPADLEHLTQPSHTVFLGMDLNEGVLHRDSLANIPLFRDTGQVALEAGHLGRPLLAGS